MEGTLGTERAIEQSGGGMVFTPPGKADGTFLLGEADLPNLTRYEVNERNELTKGITLGFGDYGVTSGWGPVAWVDEHTAYLIDQAQLQVIRFDPVEMTIQGAHKIAGIEREGYVTELSGYYVVREDGLFFPVRWRKEWEDPTPQAPAGAMLVHVDPDTDLVTVSEDARCTSLLVSKTLENGDTYWFSDNYNAYARILGGAERGVPDCALRLRKGERQFDPDFLLELSERTGGRPADAALAGSGSTVWLSVYHEEQVMAAPPDDIDSTDVAPAWQWYALDLESDAAAIENDQQPYGGHAAFGWYTSGRSFSSSTNQDYSESKLVELDASGISVRATVPGLLDAIVRVR